jgi:hypothetical protein
MNRFNETPTGYKFDKLIFFGIILCLAGIVVYNFMLNGYENHPYLKCTAEKCINPIAMPSICPGVYCPPVKCDEAWCSQKTVSRGEYGQKPSFLQTNFSLIVWILLILAFVLNHFIHNKNIKFSIPTKRKLLPSWLAFLVRKVYPGFNNEIDFKKVDLNKLED